MEFSVSAGLFREGLQKAVNVIPSKTTFPIINHVLITTDGDKIAVTGTDLEVSLKTTIPVQVKQKGSLALPGKIVSDILRQMPDVELLIKAEQGNRVLIKTDFGEYHISGENEKEFPSLPEIDVKDKIKLKCDVLLRIIDKTSFAVSVGEIRSSLMGVYFQILKNEIRGVGTDGHRLVKVVNTSVKPGKDMGGYIISKKSLDLLTKNAENIEEIEISLGESYIIFNLGDTVIYSRLLEGIYPDYEKVIPKTNDKRLVVNRESIEASLRRVSIFANKITHQVLLGLKTGELELKTQDSDFGKEAVEQISAEYSGEDLLMGYNAMYLMDILRHVDTDDVEFNFGSSTSAGLVTPAVQNEGEEIVMLVMPIKLT